MKAHLLSEELTNLAIEGKTSKEAAQELGLSYYHVRYMAKKYGISFVRDKKFWQNSIFPKRKADMRERYLKGETFKQIGDSYNISKERTRQVIDLCKRPLKFND